LDEPTSGLDTSTAYNIVRILKDAANNGYAVACSIHQPSAQMFEMFDMLVVRYYCAFDLVAVA
jgi:ATP-binding cassette, subfamily G (WHITE), member 2, SNQ2